MRTKEKRSFWSGLQRCLPFVLGLLLVVVTLAVLLHRLGDYPLKDWDEAIYVEVNREICRTGDVLTPHYNHEPYYNKPPLYFWLGHLPMRWFGFSEFTARLPGIMFGALAIGALALFGAELGGWFCGICAGFMLLSAAPFLENGSRHATPDSLLTLCTLAAYAAQWLGRERPRWRLAMAAFAGLAFMTKGAAAIPLWLGLFAVHLILRDHRAWKPRDYLAPAGVICGIILPWYAAQTLIAGRAFWHKHAYWSVWQRATQGGVIATSHEQGGRTYYVEFLLSAMTYLWPLLLALAVWIWCAKVWRPGQLRAIWNASRPRIVTLLVAVVMPVAVFSAAKNKAWWYVIPVVPVICLAGSLLFVAAWRRAASFLPGRLVLLAALVLLSLNGSRQIAGTLDGQFRRSWRAYGAISTVAKSLEAQAAALGIANPVVVIPKESPSIAAYIPHPVIVDMFYQDHLASGTLRAPAGCGLFVIDRDTEVNKLPASLGAQVLFAKSHLVLAWLPGAVHPP